MPIPSRSMMKRKGMTPPAVTKELYRIMSRREFSESVSQRAAKKNESVVR